MPLAGHGLRPTPLRPLASRPQLKRDPLGSQQGPVDISDQALDRVVFTTLDHAPFALSLRELAQRVARSEEVVEAALGRLVAAGRVNMTADQRTRAYYTKNEHLM